MEYSKTLSLVLDIAKRFSSRGAGWSQQSTVLAEVATQVPDAQRNLRAQQLILTCWHDLFRLGQLSWGYNIDNPDAPFFHVPESDVERDRRR
ncbi:MAG: hypothetical protein C0467_29650 [Planctomycetaceae bacterium]|nr:hypothetical protein [Planctomycetaceae bacterium]